MQFGVELFNESRTAFLREQNRLKGKQDLFVLSPSDKPYIVIEIATVEKSGDLPPNLGKSKVDLDHPVRLYLHSQSSDGLIPIEFQYHAHGVQGPRHLYHYVTYIKPVRK
jgi:hypothetical protein